MTDGGIATAPTTGRSPITERILEWIGPPRWLWILLWGSVALIRPVVLLVALRVSGQALDSRELVSVVVSQAVLGYITVVTLLGVRLIVRGAQALAPDLATLARTEKALDFFSWMGSTAGPIVLLALVSAVSIVTEWRRWGIVPVLADVPLMVVHTLPIMAFVWTYLALLAGLNRLGEYRLLLEPFPQDRSLGVKPIGSLALTGFWLVLAAAIPLIAVTSSNPVTVGISLVVIGASVALFFLSMVRIHRQMADAKARNLEIARALYREAYEPVRKDPSLKTLQAQGPALGVAQALVERAERVQEWPIDERATAWVAVIVTGVVTSLIVRLVLVAAGV